MRCAWAEFKELSLIPTAEASFGGLGAVAPKGKRKKERKKEKRERKIKKKEGNYE